MQSVIDKSFRALSQPQDLRLFYKNRLEQLSESQKKQKSQKIAGLFKKLPFFNQSQQPLQSNQPSQSQQPNQFPQPSPTHQIRQTLPHRHASRSGHPFQLGPKNQNLDLSPKPWIAIYKALKTEPDLSFLEQSPLKDQLCYPVVTGDRLEFYSNPKQKWAKNRFQIPEPVEAQQVPLKDISVFCIPGVCFDRKGGRLGKGLGYYDKTLSYFKHKKDFLNSSPWRVGIAFKEQISNEDLPLKEHDIGMDLLLTDAFILAPQGTKKKGN